MTVQQIKKRIDSILIYMTDHWDFVNCHMVNYLTDKHWQRFVPEQLRHEVQALDEVAKCINGVFFGSDTEESNERNYPQFANFLKKAEQHRLSSAPEIVTTREQLDTILQRQRDETENLSIKEFMNDKKKHEVEIIADIIDGVLGHYKRTQQQDEIFLADAGDGKGYLSSRLALQYGYKVLGIDFKETNTENALERSKKLERVWPALSERALLEMKGLKQQRNSQENPNKSKVSTVNYKTISKFITTDLDIAQILRETFSVNTTALPVYCLSGLHTCGNLAPTCLRVFHSQHECKILCNVGCCYHLLQEEYTDNEFYANNNLMEMQTESGFPMSDYLRQRKVKLGRNARMLAAQSIERTVNGKELPNISLFYRALLEVLICEKNPELKNSLQVGKIKKYTNFREYLELCEKKSQLNLTPIKSQAELEAFEKRFEADKHYLELFYLLRMSFAPVLESLIMLDRLLYLKELNYEHSYLISVFDPVISPRNLGIVAWKQ